jgi:hypothetical protein
MSTPAYEYGQLLRRLRDGYVRMFEQMAAGFAGVALPRPESAAEQREAASIRLYQHRIAAERRQGLGYVERIARQARRELGLPS